MFIAVEGMIGSGKSSLINCLGEAMQNDLQLRGAIHAPVSIEFPSFGRIGSVIHATRTVDAMGRQPRPIAADAQLHLALADLYDEMPRWDTRLDEGSHVLCERYIVGLRVHEIDHHTPYTVHHLCRKAEEILATPDLYVVLRIDPEIARKRVMLRSRPGSNLPDIDHLHVLNDRFVQAAGSLGSWLPQGDRGVLLLDGAEPAHTLVPCILERLRTLLRSSQAA